MMQAPLDLSLNMYSVKRSSPIEHTNYSTPKPRKSTVTLEPLKDKKQTDLRLFLVPFALPNDNSTETQTKSESRQIFSISSDSDTDLSDHAPIEPLPKAYLPLPEKITGLKRKFNARTLNDGKAISLLSPNTETKIPKYNTKTDSKIPSKPTFARKRASPVTPKQTILELNNLASVYRKITGSNTSHPPQRIVEEYYRFSYIRNNPKQQWGSYEFYHTFGYLQKICGTEKAVELSSFLLNRQIDEIREYMGLEIILNPDAQLIPKQERINLFQGTPERTNTANPWKKLMDPSRMASRKQKDEPLAVVPHSPPPKDTIEHTWSNAWLALLEGLGLGKSYSNKLHEIYYSHQWVRERYLTLKKSKNEFDDGRLLDQLKLILPATKHSFLAYLIASISGKPLKHVRNFFFLQTNSKNHANAMASDNLHDYTTKKTLELQDCLRPLLNELGETEPKDLKSVEALIASYEKRQKRHDSSLLTKLCERSRVILVSASIESGGFFVVNTIDQGRIPEFTWIKENILGRNLRETLSDMEFLTGCSCRGDCAKNIGGCQCMHEMQPSKNSKHLPPFIDGKLNPNFQKGYPIYECNSACSCGETCGNRVVQQTPDLNFIIFKDRRKGWGVRTLDLIPQGTYICEYMGEVITSEEAESRGKIYDNRGLSFLLDLDLYGRDCQYTLDATDYGNIARFFNHSCEPNADIYYVFVDILDWARPKICFFANKDIQPGEEITFDYKYEYDVINRRLRCFCGTPSCRKWLV